MWCAGGTFYLHKGGAANYLCMPLDPEYTLPYQAGVRNHKYIFGTEYQYPLQGSHDHACVDRGQESLPGSQANTDGALFYHVETSCNGMPCPPYDPPNERFTAT